MHSSKLTDKIQLPVQCFQDDICTSVIVVLEAPFYTLLSGMAKQLTSDDILSFLSIKKLMMKALL